jgi:4-amino-4-deoxy-L-arabinose transferase-like glycosyltransferase
MQAARLTKLAPYIILAGSLIIRIIQLASMPDNPRAYQVGADEDYYIRFGMDVVSGTGGMSSEFLFMDPLFGYFLGLVFSVFGKNLFTVYLLQILVDTATVGLIYLIGKELKSPRAGLIAALLYSITSTAIFYSATILKPTLVAFYFASWTYFSLSLWKNSTWWKLLIYGLFLGIGVALRSNLLLMAITGLVFVPFGNYFYQGISKKNSAINGLLILVGLSAILTVLSYRSALISGHWSFLPPNGGVVLHHVYNAENPRALYGFPRFVSSKRPLDILNDYQHAAERREGRTLSTYEMSNYWRTQAFDYVMANPIQTFSNVMRKAFEFFSYKEVANNRALNEGEHFSTILAILPRPFGILVALGIPGLILFTSRNSKGWLLLAAAGTVITTFVLFFAISRFRFPLTPIFAVGAGFTLDTLLNWKVNSRRPLIALIAGIALIGGLSFWSGSKTKEPITDYMLVDWAWGFLKMGDIQSAQSLSRQVLQNNPDNYRGNDFAGFLALMKKDYAAAAKFYARALKIKPDDHIILYNYALSQEHLGHFEKALQAINKAILLNKLPEYLFKKATLLKSLGRNKDSISILRKLTRPNVANRGAKWSKFSNEAKVLLRNKP